MLAMQGDLDEPSGARLAGPAWHTVRAAQLPYGYREGRGVGGAGAGVSRAADGEDAHIRERHGGARTGDARWGPVGGVWPGEEGDRQARYPHGLTGSGACDDRLRYRLDSSV